MKIKVVILDHDVEFMNRLAKAFHMRYEDKISLFMFSDEKAMHESLKSIRADVILADRLINVSEGNAWKPVVGRVCDISEVEELDGIPAICKYQSVEKIYNSILELYAEHSEKMTLKKNDSDVRIILFTSVQGGAGTSSAAAAYALYSAREGRKVFYLNLEEFGDADLYFAGNGTLSFSDVIYSLKSKTGNLELKLEGIIQTDPSGVDFFHACKNAYDMIELQDQEIEVLISAISHVKKYEEIIVDLSGDLTERILRLINGCADRIVYVSDGSETGNKKFEKFCEAARVLEQRNEWNILDKAALLYNRYSSKTSVQLEKTAIPVIGGIHRFEGTSGKELVQQIAAVDVIGRI